MANGEYIEKYNYWESGTGKNNMQFVVHRDSSALWFIVFVEYVRSLL